tara:strand:+ start:7728 stop:7982 length:255 start_codon:yes stop_codon:yes gene_type:complete
MLLVYTAWTEEQHNEYYSREWKKGDWDFWDNFICNDFIKEWSYSELIESLEKDFADELKLKQIVDKYLVKESTPDFSDYYEMFD